MPFPIKDRKDEPIRPGDHVYTKYRGGSHQGEVERLVVDEVGAREEEVTHPPKIVFKDQHGHRVAHNPSSLDRRG